MKLKEISKDIYDVDAWLDEELGKEGTPEREASIEKAWEEYNGQILLDARKNARLTQEELANRIGADKSYISKIERGLITPTVSTLYRIAARYGFVGRVAPTLTTRSTVLHESRFSSFKLSIMAGSLSYSKSAPVLLYVQIQAFCR